MSESTLNPPVSKSRAAAPRLAARRKSADQRLRIMERLIAGLTVAHIAKAENLTLRRVRRIIGESFDRREIDPPAVFARLQIARLSEAMVVAHTMMAEGNLDALDRMIRLTSELDRYYGLAHTGAASTCE